MSRRRPGSVRPSLEILEDRTVPTTGWAVNWGHPGDITGLADVAVDALGNVYATGNFYTTTDFDPGPGVANLVSAGSQEGFVAKYAADGTFLWARRVGGSGSDWIYGLEVVGDAVYVCGTFSGSADIGGTTFNSAGGSDAFVARLDSAGNFTWVAAYGGTGTDYAYSLAVVAGGNVVATGQFTGPVDFDPGPGTATLTGGGAYALKLNTGGGYLWARGLNTGIGNAVDTDALGNIYVGGIVSGGPFVTKLATDGMTVWQFSRAGSGYAPNTTAANGLAVDDRDADSANWAVYLQGLGDGVTLPSGPAVSKLAAGTGAILWNRFFYGSTYGTADGAFVEPQALALGPTGDIYVTGSFDVSGGIIDFDPGTGTAFLTSATSTSYPYQRDGYLARLDSAGNYVAAHRMGSNDWDTPRALAVDTIGQVYLGGFFGRNSTTGSTPGSFDTGDRTVTLDANVGPAFLVKMTTGYGAINGRVVRDANANGRDDEGYGLQGWTVYLDQDADGQLDPGEQTATTDASGFYSFANLPVGAYVVAQVPRAGWTATTPASVTVTLGDGQVPNITFGDTATTTVRTYSSTNVSRNTVNGQTVVSMLTVPDNFNILDLDVRISVTHNKVQELKLVLRGPDGSQVQLMAAGSGQSGKKLTNTIFDDEATQTLPQGSAPYTGRFLPVYAQIGYDTRKLTWWDGMLTAGTWTLEITDGGSSTTGTLTAWSMLITTASGSALRAEGGPAAGSTPGKLTDAALRPLVEEAIARWEAAGVGAEAVAQLRATQVRIADVGPGFLGLQDGDTIWIDDDAAGFGWFIDPTPADDREFERRGDQGEQGRIDLLSALMHEVGHRLGLDHDHGTMSETLAAGVRIAPSAEHDEPTPAALDQAFAAGITGGRLAAATLPTAPSAEAREVGWADLTIALEKLQKERHRS